ncbi:MAG TPA: DUF502 domain-containing protein, partial [Candidatus Hydrogenedentes bacterium]|nr:DUF502 domain-containing protein [Candidatus Hydrogenedentota bacterium]
PPADISPRRSRPPRTAGRDGEPDEPGFFGFWRRYFYHLRRYLVRGMLVWVPLIVTLWIVWVAITRIVGGIEGLIRWFVTYLNGVGGRVPSLRFLTVIEYTPGLGMLTAILIFLTTGLLARYLVTRRLIRLGEVLLARIPLINKVYRAVQQTRDVFVGRGAVFQEVVLVEYPRRGIWAVGFITAEGDGVIPQTHGAPLTAVFVPTTPNPTSGFLLYFPPEEVTPVDMSVEEAMKLIISGGALDPKSGPLLEFIADDDVPF